MAISKADDWQVNCPACGIVATAQLWGLIDALERPDLLARVRSRTLRIYECEKCGHPSRLPDVFLLLYRGPDHNVILTSTGKQATPYGEWTARERLALDYYLGLLERGLSAAPTGDKLYQIDRVPMNVLHLVVDSARLAVIDEFANGDWAAQRRLIADHPELSAADSIEPLHVQMLSARSRMDRAGEQKARDARELLLRVNEVGVDDAFDAVTPVRILIAQLQTDFPDMAALVREMLDAGIDVTSGPGLAALLESNAHWRQRWDTAAREVFRRIDTELAQPGLSHARRAELYRHFLSLLDSPAAAVSELQFQLGRELVADGDPANLTEAIDAFSAALAAVRNSAAPAARSTLLVALGVALAQRGDPEDLDLADEYLRQASQLAPPDADGLLATIQLNRAAVIMARVDRGDDTPAAAIPIFEKLIAANHPETRAPANGGLARCYFVLPDGDRAANLRKAAQHATQALDLTEQSERLPRMQLLLLLAQIEITRATEDPERPLQPGITTCRKGIEQAAALQWQDFVLAFSSLQGAALTQVERWTEAAAAYETAVAAADSIYDSEASEAARVDVVSAVRGLTSRAGYAVAKAGHTARAADIIERGRARALGRFFLRETAELRTLANTHPDLCDRFRQAADMRRQLEAHARGAETGISADTDPPPATVADYAARANAELRSVTVEIRAVAGHENFLVAPPLSELSRKLAPKQAAAYLCTTGIGSLALIVTPAAAGAEVAPAVVFADLNDDDIVALLPDVETGTVALAEVLRTNLRSAISVVGQRLIAPLAVALVDLGVQSVILIPTGLLAALPLHAAEVVPLPAAPDSPLRCLLDYVDVSYAPSLRVYAGVTVDAGDQRGRAPYLVGVADPTPSCPPLPFARIELAHIVSLFGGRSKPLYDQLAAETYLSVLASRATHVHMACHGYFSTAAPYDSFLELAGDDRLTLRDVMNRDDFDDVRLVVLSACQTAVTDVAHQPDEAIGLPAGFLHAGVPGVVGALWSVNDVSTALLMAEFYRSLLGQPPMTPSAALRAAQRRVATITLAEITAFVADPVTRGADPALAQRLLAAVSAKGVASLAQRPYADPFYWAAFTVNGC